jgi:2-amino-4-hydroxy-6-hydroxymethyldihydropteridine diphosphokinase
MFRSMNHAYLLIGGNIGDRIENLRKTRAIIAAVCGPILLESSIFETSPWGKTDQADFLNQALWVETALAPTLLLEKILGIEQELGRFRAEKFGPRIIDIDIIFYNDEVLVLPSLTIPHPHMQNRRFVMAPMAEIAPGLVHPLLRKNMTELLEECPDTLAVDKKT